MKVLLIGSGSIGRRHVASLKLLVPDLEWVLLRHDGREDTFSADLGARVHPTLSAALAERPDLAVVATPSSLHIDVLPPLLAAGIALYIEKPVVTDAVQLEQLKRALAAAPGAGPTLVGCNLRFLPALTRMQALLTSGALGRLVRADFQAGQWLPDWRPATDYRQGYSASRELGGGVMLDLIHEIDAARWMLGDIDGIKALAGHVSTLEIMTEDVAVMLLRARSGALASVSVDYVSRKPIRRYHVVGELGSVTCDLIGKRLVLDLPGGDQQVLSDVSADFDVPATYPAAMAELIGAMGAGRKTNQPLEEGIASLELLLRARLDALNI
ncbi:Gfo/Idh/MocA family protein [Bordetella genomosp. 1]|uniref:Oxidoreductase n=1 Tax=Bordetella genomosp. 1 TaxID=1395607 RepID=A0ABX4F3F0_9BORD|nr:Gfo/Idh/MocA family oxidoreductase [Bordetella genomosp. 1]OZI68284.1 hypothetical protein CAL27_02080 [Bordetella genomosp. 1]